MQAGATPDTAASKAALQQTVQQTPAEDVTPRAARYSQSQGAPQSYAVAPDEAERIRNLPLASAPVESSAVPAGSPFHDPAAPILSAAPISKDDKAILWDHIHRSLNTDDFAKRIAPFYVPTDLKHLLYVAKAQATPAIPAVDKVVGAMQKMSLLGPAALYNAEKHANVLRALTSRPQS